MASTERSLGWATSGTGDGPAGGYDSTRWRANAQKSDGTGITLYGSYMAMSGTGTSTLTIADGAAIINGYTYETNGSVTISVTGLNGNYLVYLIANTAAGTQTVTANGAGTTTVAASTIRVAIITSAQSSTITASIGAANLILLGNVTITAGSITSIAANQTTEPLAKSLSLSKSVYAYMTIPGSSTAASGASTVIFSSGATSGEGALSCTPASGVITAYYSGVYMVTGQVYWDSNTTGSRYLTINITGGSGTELGSGQIIQTNSASAISYNPRMQISGLVYLTPGASVSLVVSQNSGSSRTYTDTYFMLALV
jgi:hypothetical protein